MKQALRNQVLKQIRKRATLETIDDIIAALRTTTWNQILGNLLGCRDRDNEIGVCAVGAIAMRFNGFDKDDEECFLDSNEIDLETINNLDSDFEDKLNDILNEYDLHLSDIFEWNDTDEMSFNDIADRLEDFKNGVSWLQGLRK